MVFTVEISYSYGTYWTFWCEYDCLEKARHSVKMLTVTSPENFKARILKSEIVE